MTKTKLFAIVALAIAAVSAHAFTYSNLVSADVNLKGFSGTSTLTVGGAAIGPANTTGLIDFFPTNLYAGGVSGLVTDNYSFQYDVSNSVATQQIGVDLLGTIAGLGTVTFSESVFKLVGGVVTGPALVSYTTTFNSSTVSSNLTRSGDNYTFVDNTGLFTAPATDYRVIKTIALTVGTTDYNHANDYASMTLIEQNHQPVPEPASIAALGLGAIALIRRRRTQR